MPNKKEAFRLIKKGTISAVLGALLGTVVNAAIDTSGADFSKSKTGGAIAAGAVGALIGKGAGRLGLLTGVGLAISAYRLFND
jgi:hypothetical protein